MSRDNYLLINRKSFIERGKTITDEKYIKNPQSD